MSTIISRLHFIFIIIVSFTFLVSGKVFAAGLPYDVTAGHLATPLNVSWQVIGGSQTCNGTTANDKYPFISGGSADQIFTNWTAGTKPSVGTMSITDVYADPGNVVGGYKDYTLTCTDQTSGESDFVVLRVHNPCTATATWNSLSHSCVANAVAPTISSFTGSSVVNYGNTATLSYSVSGATSCDINGISVSGGTYTTPALTSTSNFTLTCSNAGLSTVNGPITVTVASGSFTAPTGGTSCSIARGLSYCQTTLAWNSVNMSSPAIQNGAGATLSTAASNAGMIANVKYSGDTFTLKNGSVNHDSRTVSADCAGSDLWSGGICVAPTCSNGANNPVACTQCSTGDYWNGTGCSPCTNGGCSGAGGSSTTPTGSLYCNNGSNQAPACPAPVTGSCNLTHYSCVAGGSANNQSLSDRWTWYCSGINGGGNSSTCTEMKPSKSYFTVGNCTIAIGGSSCSMPITWGVTNPIAPRVYIQGDFSWTWGVYQPGSVGADFGPGSGPGARSFTLWDQGNLDTLNGTATCASGSTWNGSICAAPSGTLSATGCDIQLGASTCDLVISGTISNGIAPWVYINKNTLWTWTPGHNAPPIFDYSPWPGITGPQADVTFTLADVNGTLDEKVVVQKCVAGTTWDGPQVKCVASPTVNITANTAYGNVSSGSLVANYTENPSFSWSTSGFPTTCNLYKDGTNTGTVNGSGTQNTGVLSSGQTLSIFIRCSNVNGGTDSNTLNLHVPPAPLTVSATCVVPGTQLTLTTTLPNGYSYMHHRIYDDTSGQWLVNDWMNSGNPLQPVTIPGHTYSYWVHTSQSDTVSAYSAATGGVPVFCTPPAPAPVLSAFTTKSTHLPANSIVGIVSKDEDVRLSWGAVLYATSCTINTIPVSETGGTMDIIATGWGASNAKDFTLSCTGLGGTTDSIVRLSYPPASTSITSKTCTFNQNGSSTLTYTWAQPNGWTHFQTRATTTIGGIPTSIGPPAYDDDFVGTTKTFSINPIGATQTYDLSVWTRSTNGALSAETTSQKTCTRPTPDVTLTSTTINGGSTGSAYYNETGASLAWTANYAANTCDLYKNGILVNTYLYPSTTSYTLPAVTSNSIYKVTCSNGVIGTSPNVNITVPPKLVTADGICPAPGNKGTLTWTYPTGYTGSIYRIFDTTGGSALNCTGTDICSNTATGNKKEFASILDHTYTWMLYTRDVSNQNFSDVSGSSFTCQAPDLVAGNIFTINPLPTTETATTTLEAYVNNNGSLTTGASFFSFFQIRNNISNVITDLTPINSPALPPYTNNTILLSMKYKFPTSGSWSIRICTDKSDSSDLGNIPESNENNNCSPLWTTIQVQTLPTLSLIPNTTQNTAPGVPVQVISTTTDPDNNIIEHNFDYFFTNPLGLTLSVYTGLSTTDVADVTAVSGIEGAIPMTGNNTYNRIFKPLRPGTYSVQASVKESIFKDYITKSFTINVSCMTDEWWDESQKSCVKPVATLSTDCLNGALNAPTCDLCSPTDIYSNGKCITGTACYVSSVPLTPAKCGNSIVERGEECDGIAGLSNTTKQKCTSKCTITCQSGVSNTFGSPSCGAGANKVFNSLGVPVTSCTNGALQSSAPSCASLNKQNECPVGNVDTLINGSYVCKSPYCGDKILNGGEECDGQQGVGVGQFCAANCCVFTTNPLLPPGANLPKFTLTCQNADRYTITANGGNIVAGPAVYTAPVIFNPNAENTYIYRCYSSLNPMAFDEKTQTATTPSPTTTNTSLASLFLTATPKSISANSNVTVSWVIEKPDNLCKIMVQPVITVPTKSCDANCVASRYRESDRLNGEFTYGVTDVNDGARSILSAMRTASINGKAAGRKSVTLNYSTIFYSACSVNPVADTKAVKVKVSVTGDQEG